MKLFADLYDANGIRLASHVEVEFKIAAPTAQAPGLFIHRAIAALSTVVAGEEMVSFMACDNPAQKISDGKFTFTIRPNPFYKPLPPARHEIGNLADYDM